MQFGDPLTLHIAARFDNRVVLPGTFRLTSNVAPLTQLGPTRTDAHEPRPPHGRVGVDPDRLRGRGLREAAG